MNVLLRTLIAGSTTVALFGIGLGIASHVLGDRHRERLGEIESQGAPTTLRGLTPGPRTWAKWTETLPPTPAFLGRPAMSYAASDAPELDAWRQLARESLDSLRAECQPGQEPIRMMGGDVRDSSELDLAMKLIVGEAMAAQFVDGDAEAAAVCLADGLHLLERMEGPSWTLALTRPRSEQRLITALRRIAQQPGFPALEVWRVLDEPLARSAVRDWFTPSTERERARHLDQIEMNTRDFRGWPLRAPLYFESLCALRSFDMLEVLSQGPGFDIGHGVMTQSVPETPYRMAEMLHDRGVEVLWADVWRRAQAGLTRVLLAMYGELGESGEWPTRHEQLAGWFPDGLPADPYSHGPFILIATDKELKVGAAVPQQSPSEGLMWTLPRE